MLVTRVVTCACGGCNVFLVEKVTSTLTTHHSMAVLSEREIRNWLDECDPTPLAITYCMIISGNLQTRWRNLHVKRLSARTKQCQMSDREP